MEKIWLQHYPKNVPATIDLNTFDSLVHFFKSCCERYGHHVAYSNFGNTLTYVQLENYAKQFATYLQTQCGCSKGSRLGIILPNILQYPVTLFGAFLAGCVVVNVNPLYTAHEMAEQLKDAGTEVVVVLANFAHTLAQALPETGVKHVVVTEIGDLFPKWRRRVANFLVKHVKRMIPQYTFPHSITFRAALEKGKQGNVNIPHLTQKDLAFLQYTGGTTGVSKGAMLSHGNMVANVQQAHAWMKPALNDGQETVITALPLYHIFSLTANCLAFLWFGAHNVLITNPRNMKQFIHELKRFPFSCITGVNTLFNALLHQPAFRKMNFKALRLALGGGMAVQEAVAQEWRKITGKPLLEAYGLTETSPAVTINPLNLADYNGSIGLPVPSTDIAIRNEAGEEVPLGEVGELFVKGPQVMQGYWQRPEETAKVLDDEGWLATGDMARIDEKGFVYLLERKKDMILVSGFNVYPNEVEAVIAAHPMVKEVAVVGEPHAVSGEVVKAYIIPSDNRLEQRDIIAHCRQRLTGYKVPKRIEFRDELPKSAVGKVLRRHLRNPS
ncbi:MAG: AMP-binding protein [Gammaproteobacteria bacterium]